MRDEQEEKNGLGFTVTDKRGQNNPIQEPRKPQSEIADNAPVKNGVWKSVAYMIVFNQHPQGGPMILGRAAGLANDGDVYVADYLFGMRWEAGFDWTIDAKRRLDTFLTCQCSGKTGQCAYHRRVAPNGWLKEDTDRLRDEGDRPVPEVLEVLFKAERAKQMAQRVLVPRR